MMREWSLPLYPAERHLLVAELERVQFMGDEESEIVQFILRQFPERPSHPHALVVGRGFWNGGAVGGGSIPRQQQQLQQHWSRDSGIPRQEQQLQHWFHDGGIPRQKQQQWPRGGCNPHQHQRSSHTVPPARPARQQPSRGIHTSGGDGEHGRNPLSAPATEAVPDTSAFPAASSKAVVEASTSSAGAASTVVPAAAPETDGTVFLTTSVGGRPGRPLLKMKQRHRKQRRRPTTLFSPLHRWGGAARAPAPADEAAALTAATATSDTVPSAAPARGAVGARESSAGAASSAAAAEAAHSTCNTTAPVASGARAARKLGSEAGHFSKICGERGASTHLFDPGTVSPLEVRYSDSSINSSNSRGNGSSCSSNDTTSNHDSWWEATYVGALLRPFDPGKGCQRDARIGVILGLDLPFDRGKA